MAVPGKTQIEHQLAIFTLARESFGISVSVVREIIRMQDVTHVPGAPDYVEGVINLRGKIIPMVDLRKRFGFKTTERTSNSRIIVVRCEGQDVGIIVDAVTEVLRISGEEVEEVPETLTAESRKCVMGIGKTKGRLIVILDVVALLSHDGDGTALLQFLGANGEKPASKDHLHGAA